MATFRASSMLAAVTVILACGALILFRIGFNRHEYFSGPDFLASLTLTIFSFGAAALFMAGLSNFKHDVHRAYGLLSAGIAIYALGQLSVALVDLLPFLVNYIALPYIVSITLIFLGMRRLAKTIQLKSFWMSPPWAYGISTVIAYLVTLVPHTPNPLEEIAFDLTNAMATWSCVMLLFTMAIAIQVRAAIATRYRASLSWMIAGLIALVSSGALFVVTVIVLPVDHSFFDTALQLIPTLLSSMLFMWAGYSFTQVEAGTYQTAARTQATPIDVITYIAGLASVPKEIDQQLDVLRSITAQINDQQQLTSAQEGRLAQLYKTLEDYLIKHERLQTFTAAQLREAVRTRFQFQKNVQSPFWSLFAE